MFSKKIGTVSNKIKILEDGIEKDTFEEVVEDLYNENVKISRKIE